MPRGTPEETFGEARAAMERGDWEGAFACLEPADVAKIAKNTFARFLMAGGAAADAFLQICGSHGISDATIADIRARGQAIIQSGRQPGLAPGPAMLEQSRRHQELVKAYQQAQEDALDAVADLAAFTGALERAVRADGTGGSVSSQLFVGERLEGGLDRGHQGLGHAPDGQLRHRGSRLRPAQERLVYPPLRPPTLMGSFYLARP